MRTPIPALPPLVLVLCAASAASAVTVWNEGVNGDLSTDRLNPTGIMLNAGSNVLMATSQGTDREYVRFTLGPGLALANINHLSWVSSDNIGFIGVQAGNTFTEPPTGTNVANLLGYSHFGTATIGTDVLPAIGTGAGSQTFTPPLTGSNYTFWIQQTGASPATYQLEFFVTPAPSVGVMTAMALSVLASRRRR